MTTPQRENRFGESDHDPGVLLVDAPDVGVVLQLLPDAVPGLTAHVVATDAGLGLAKLALPNLVEAVRGARGDTADRAERADLDVVLRRLRDRARSAFHGWCPVVDKNRGIGAVHSWGQVKYAVGDPVIELEPPADLVAELTAPAEPDGPWIGVADARYFAHETLVGRCIGRPLTAGPFDDTSCGHATMVAGTVLRRAPRSRLVCRAVLRRGDRNWAWDVARRLLPFLDDGVSVLNMSFGCLTDGSVPLALRRAMDRLGGSMVLVAAAGNHGEGAGMTVAPAFPAAFGDVVAVGAADARGTASRFTPDVPWLDLLAPGEDVVGPFESGYARWSGSSFAAATVTGEIARRMLGRRVDAFEARDELLAAGDIVGYRYDYRRYVQR